MMKKSRRPNQVGVGKPVLHIDPGGGQLRHPYQHEHHPVVPAGEKAGEQLCYRQVGREPDTGSSTTISPSWRDRKATIPATA